MLLSNSLKRVSTGLGSNRTRQIESWLAFRNVVNAHRRRYTVNSPGAAQNHSTSEDAPTHASSSARISGFSGDVGPQANKTTRGRVIMELVDKSRSARFRDCLEIADRMKTAGMQPDLVAYNALMESAAKSTPLQMDSWAILEDLLASGLEPDVRTMNSLLKAQSKYLSPYFWLVLQKMNEMKISPNSATFSIISSYFLEAGNFEMALQWLYSSSVYGVVPEFDITQSVIVTAARRGYPRLAIDLIDWYEDLSVRRVDKETWMDCLIASAEALYGEGTERAWNMAIHEHQQLPGEGLSTIVLNTAARCGLPDLATDVLELLESKNIDISESHATSLIEAFIKKGDLKNAIQALPVVEGLGAKIRSQASFVFADHLKTTDDIDECWSFIDSLQSSNKVVHPSILHGLIKAAVGISDMQRAIGLYKSMSEYNISPDTAVFNTLLEGCISIRHRKLGDSLLNDMSKAEVPRDSETYRHFISLCLTQDDYQDAFWYLEEMKAAGFKPPYSVYAEVIETLVQREDSRYKVAVHEMKEQKYHLSPGLEKTVARADTFRFKNDPSSRSHGLSPIDGAALRFIESGGVQGAAELPTERSS